MFNRHRIVFSVVLATLSSVAQAAPDDLMTRHQAGLYGMELYSIGAYNQALVYLRAASYGRVDRPPAVAGLQLSDPSVPPKGRTDFARALAEVYWEIGDAESAAYVARTLISTPSYTLWRCKQAEQVMALDYAYDCYTFLKEPERARRVVRQQVVFGHD